MNYISLATAKQLKSWGCDVLCKSFTQVGHSKGTAYSYDSISDSGDSSCVHEYKKSQFINVYSLNEIICNGDMAKAFFMEEFNARFGAKTCSHIEMILNLLATNKQEEAEQYLLAHCVWNPKNQKDLLGEAYGFSKDIDLLNSL